MPMGQLALPVLLVLLVLPDLLEQLDLLVHKAQPELTD